MPSTLDHPALLEAAHRGLALAQLAWLRQVHVSDEAQAPLERLFSDEGRELLEQAVREGRYASATLPWVAAQLASVARAFVLLEARPLLAAVLNTRAPLGMGAELPSELLSRLTEPPDRQFEPAAIARSLADVLAPHAQRFIDLHARAAQLAAAQLAAAQLVAKLTPVPAADAARAEQAGAAQNIKAASAPDAVRAGQAGVAQNIKAAPEPPPTAAGPEHLVRAEQFLAQTEDATRELTRWLIKRAAGGGTVQYDLGQLWSALRARELDGLARPSKRFYRIAEGARRLGFERDMSARMHAEPGAPLLVPLARTVQVAVPGDVRVTQPGLEYGVLSDVTAAQGVGEALALALVSPALSAPQRRPVGRSISAAFGGLYAQLRADPGYLRRIDGFDKAPAANAARHAGLWLLLRARLAAALSLAEHAAVRSESERVLQLMAASERALGQALPAGMVALALLTSRPETGDFIALADGCELHAALRERYDHDFYLNPRVSEVLRGAAARGNALDAAALGSELHSSHGAGIARMLELIA